MPPKIKTHSTETFREEFMKPGERLEELLKPGYGKFFAVRVQELIRLIRLPVPPARATTHTFIYLTEGYITMDVGGETYTIYRDECLFVPAGRIYSIGNVDVDSGTGYLCNFHNDILTGKSRKNGLLKDFEFLSPWGNPRICFDRTTSGYILQLLKRILREYTEYGLSRPDIIPSYFMALLCEISYAYRPLSDSPHKAAVSITNRFRELLFIHIRTHHRVTDYAALLHITPNHLNKVVKEITGKSPTRWIDETLMLEAKALLHQTALPVSEVAAELGMYDPSYFSRMFKKYTGITPLEFRKMIEKS